MAILRRFPPARATGHARGIPTARSRPLIETMVLAALGLSLATPPLLAQPPGERYHFDIPAGPLDTALTRFARQAGIPLAVNAELTAGLDSPGVHGELPASAALQGLLSGTGMTAVWDPDGEYTLRKLSTFTEEDLGESFALEQDGGAAVTLETMVVTPARSEVEILEAPAAISVVSREKIETRGAQTAVEALQGEPGVNISYYTENNFPVVKIRGAGDVGIVQNTDVLVLIDGIPQVNLNDQSVYEQIPFEAIERIEVVRGPTSALYGRNGVGGTINIITRDAPQETELSATLFGGSFGFIKPRFTVGGAISDTVNLLVSGSYESAEGWRDGADRKAGDFFAKADIALSPKTNVTLTAQYFDVEQGVVTILPLLPDATPVPGIKDTDNFNIPGAEARNESLQLVASFMHELSDTLLLTVPVYFRQTDRTLFRDGSFIDNIDTDTKTFDLYPFTPWAEESIIGVRPQFTWTPNSRIAIVAGADFERNDAEAGSSAIVPAGGDRFDPITVDYEAGSFSADLATLDTIATRDGDYESNVWALYGQARLGVTDRLRLTLGGRYDRQERTLADPLRPNPLIKADYGRFTPKVALDYAFTDGLHGYLSYGQGFNPPFGGAFAYERPGADALEPEVATNYEVGIKTKLPNGRGFANLASYYMKREDLVQAIRVDGVNMQMNAGGLDVWGVEFDGAYNLGGGFIVSGNYSYTDTEWQDYTVRGVSFAGSEVILTPNHLASASIDWLSRDGRFEVGAWVDYVGDRFADRANRVALDAYTLVNAQAAFRPFGDDRVTLRLQAFNLFDEEYLARTELDFLGNVLGGAPGQPASFQASINAQF